MGDKSNKELKSERIGQEAFNNNGSLMKIVEYRNNKDIDVLFVEYGYIREKVQYNDFIKGKISCVYEPTVYSMGYIGEGGAICSINGKHTEPYFTWHSMLRRCYDEKSLAKNPSYAECEVCEEWHNYNNFAQWYNDNYYEVDGEVMALDKDILIKGNKVYGPDTCIFVPQRINNLFTKSDKLRGEFPIGVYKRHNKYEAQCNCGKSKNKHLGRFDNIEEAFNAYKEFKENLIKEVADEYYNNNLIPFELYNAMYNYEVDIDD